MTMSMMGAPSLKYFKAMRFRGFGEKRELRLSRANVQAAERAIRGFRHGHARVFQQGAGFEPHERRHLQLVGCEQSWNSKQMQGWASQGRRAAFLLMSGGGAGLVGYKDSYTFRRTSSSAQ